MLGLVAGCGSGGSGGSSPGGSSNIVSGTAATGAPIAFGTVTLKDSLGATAVTTTDLNGNYSFNVSGSTAPFLLKAVPNVAGSVPLYSFADKPGIANITPMTDLVLYEALGRSEIGTVFDSGDLSKLTISAVNGAEKIVRDNFSTQLTANGLSPTTIDLFHSPFIANGVGLDAVIQDTLVNKMPGGVLRIANSGGLCVPYAGNNKGVTFAIDGINHLLQSSSFAGFFGAPPIVGGVTVGYIKEALAKCLAGQIDDVPWTGNPQFADTRNAVELLKTKLRTAYDNNRLAVSRGGEAGPINVVAHSWGSVIAYIALTELDGEASLVRVEHLITMGSPVQYLSSSCAFGLPLFICQAQTSVPDRFREQPIQFPSTVRSWANYYLTPGDTISSAIIDVGQKVQNQIVEDCPAPPLEVVSSNCTSHSVYYDTLTWTPNIIPPSTAPTLFKIQHLLGQSQVASSPVPPVVQDPATVTPPPLPGAFSVPAGAPYCDTSVPVGPAVKLTWSVSTNASFYRVFRGGKATGVQLGSSQLDFVNNLGLVAGQSYNYNVQAMNANGTTWSNTAQVTIPADVCNSNFISPPLGTITTSTVGHQPTLTASGDVTQVSFNWSGATSGSQTWFKNDTNWLNKVTSNPDGSITLRPVVTQTGDPSGTTNWTVTLRDSTGATRIQSFSVNYQPTVLGGGGSSGGTLTLTGVPASTGGTFVADSPLTSITVGSTGATGVWREAPTVFPVTHGESVSVFFNPQTGQVLSLSFQNVDGLGNTNWSCSGFTIPTCSGVTVDRTAGTLTLVNQVLKDSVSSSQITVNGRLTFPPLAAPAPTTPAPAPTTPTPAPSSPSSLTVGPASLNFGDVLVGTCSTATFAIQHVVGTSPATGTVSVSPISPFSIVSGSNFSVSNGSAANVSVRFCPTSAGVVSGTVTVSTSATVTGASTVTLTGSSTADTSPPSIPQQLTGTVDGGAIKLSWAPSTDNIAVVFYNVFRDGIFIASSMDRTFYEDTSINPSTLYSYTVSAFDAAGNNSQRSGAVAITSAEIQRFERLTGIARSTGANRIQIVWNNLNDPRIFGYRIYRNGHLLATIVGTDVFSYEDTGLLRSILYSYLITAHDVSGKEFLLSNSFSATTLSVSTTFKINDVVETTLDLIVRATPSFGAFKGIQHTGSQGTVVSGPKYVEGYWWWGINYDSGESGWTVENYLKFVSTTNPASPIQPLFPIEPDPVGSQGTFIVGPASLNLGDVQVGSCSTATFAIQHVFGTGPATGTVAVSPNPPFSIVSGSNFSVSNGSAADVSVQFCPTSAGTVSRTATVSTSATVTGAGTVTLTGTGT